MAIDSKELRIGNKVRQAHATITITQLGLKTAMATDFNRTGRVTYKGIHPIPITDKILADYGFHKHNNAWVPADFNENNYLKDYFTIWNTHDGCYNLNTTQFPVEITSIHQLQNLHYFLTGKELIYNPQ